jgi:hypothetical protein
VIKTLTEVTFTPVAEPGSEFASWGGHRDCLEGKFMMNSSKLCIAYFHKKQASLFLTTEGTGQGQVSVSTGNLDWTSNREAHATYDLDTEVLLTAIALPESYFVGWGGYEDCVDGKLEMAAERACVAYFNRNEETPQTVLIEATPTPPPVPESPVPVTTLPEVPATPSAEEAPSSTTAQSVPADVVAEAMVSPSVSLFMAKRGPGNLRSDPAGIDCGTTCQTDYPKDTVVTLIATPTAGAIFEKWSGDCNSPELTTTVTLRTDTHCQATFAETPATTTTTVPDVIPPSMTSPSAPAATTVPVTTPVLETPPLTPPFAPVTPAPVSSITTPLLVISATSTHCATSGNINEICNYGGRTVTTLNVQGHGMVSNGVLNSTLTNIGWVSNFIITVNGKLTGGVVTGYIKNEGVMLDFEFRGASIIGGTLGGKIVNASKIGGYFQDVTLLANTHIVGGILKGKIRGDQKSPALLEKVRIRQGSRLFGVKLGKNVELEKGVTVTTEETEKK